MYVYIFFFIYNNCFLKSSVERYSSKRPLVLKNLSTDILLG